MRSKTFPLFTIVLLYFFLGASPIFSEDIPNPKTFFGHKPGADYKLIRWEKIQTEFSCRNWAKQPWEIHFFWRLSPHQRIYPRLKNIKTLQRNSPKAKYLKEKPHGWLRRERPSPWSHAVCMPRNAALRRCLRNWPMCWPRTILPKYKKYWTK